MENEIKKYYEVKLVKYSKSMPISQALIAAKYAMDSLMVDVKRNLSIYTEEDVISLINQEIEDVVAAT